MHNFWHSLAEVERPSVDQMNQGVHIQMLQKGDVIKFETLRGNDGFASRITWEVTHPKQGGIRIVQVVRFLGGYQEEEIPKEQVGSGIRGRFVVRGDKHDGELPELGWIGIGADICLAGDVTFRSITNISVNNSLLIFPPSSGTVN